MIITKDTRLNTEFALHLINNIINFVFQNGGIPDFFITTENIIVEDCGKINFNHFSFVGI